ncbi:heat shock protein 70kD, peptide-binding domain-containing protein [Rhizoctonia solani]|nr:heat shock protein 70kD, peptide-binding domain-containing protein [Rhizoctonia solani]
MNLLASVICGFLQILLCVVLFAPSTVCSHQAVGISIDDLDQFVIAVSDVKILSQGYFEVRQPFFVDVTLTDSSVPHSEHGYFWSTLTAEGKDGPKLARAVFSALKTTSETTHNPLLPFRVCAITSPLALSTSQKDLVSSALAEIFGCTDDTFVIRETHAITSALNIEPDNVENSSIAIVAPNESTYILGEDSSMIVIVDTFPPPLNLDLAASKHDIREIIVVQGSEQSRFSQAYGASNIPIRYVPSDIIACGAAIIAALALPQEPVSVLPLALGIVLHGRLSHVVIPSFSVLPKQTRLTLTTVSDNQQTAVIEVREGLRTRAEDNLFVTKLQLKGIPPAPAGTIPIEVTVTVERNQNSILVEAIEAISGSKAVSMVERDELVYPEEVLSNHQAAGEKYNEEDAKFREIMAHSVSRETQPSDAVQLFVKQPSKHEEL